MFTEADSSFFFFHPLFKREDNKSLGCDRAILFMLFHLIWDVCYHLYAHMKGEEL